MSNLQETANYLVANNKGILAADESSSTIKKRFESVGIEDSVENHRRYREMLFTAPDIENYISGVIMYDETFRQQTSDGKNFREYLADRGIYPGIKVDIGKIEAPNFPGEYLTEGLDGLRDRFNEYAGMGARFAKWRAVINVGLGKPSKAIVQANAVSLARYATLAQEVGIVPIVEPEVLADGDHSIDDCELATHTTLDIVFEELMKMKVDLSGILLKPNMIIAGLDYDYKASSDEISERTIAVLEKCVPKEVAGIVFLSGGQSTDEATKNLCAVNKNDDGRWPVSFSFGRALQEESLKAWSGKDENKEAAQKIFYEIAKSDYEANAC